MVAVRWAVLATAILVTVFLMASLAQFGAVEATSPLDDPTIDIASPVLYLQDIYRENSMPIKVNVYPRWSSRQFVDIYYSLDDAPNITLGITTYETSSGIFGKGTLDNLTDGYHTVKAYSTDTQGNTISTSTTFLVDTTLGFPTFLLSPKNTTYNSKQIPLTYKLYDSKYTVSYSLDNNPYTWIDGNTTLPALSEGQHTITAKAYDLNDVIQYKHTVNFTIDTTPPTPSNEPQPSNQQAIVIAAIVVVSAFGLALLYRTKRK